MDELSLEDRVYALEYAMGHALARLVMALGADHKALAKQLRIDAAITGTTPQGDALMLRAQPLLERWARIVERAPDLFPKQS
jgi:hypothetical protein